MARRCFTLPGAPDLWTRLGWLQGSTQNGMKWGCYLKFAVLLVQSVCSPRRPKTKDPGLCALEAYIAGDTLHHQPMGVGHVTVLQLHGPMGLHVLQWCHPMLACAKRTSYCTRDHHLIWCTKSGFRSAQSYVCKTYCHPPYT